VIAFSSFYKREETYCQTIALYIDVKSRKIAVAWKNV